MWLACSTYWIICIQKAIRHLSSLQSVEICAFWWGLSLYKLGLPVIHLGLGGIGKRERQIVPSTHALTSWLAKLNMCLFHKSNIIFLVQANGLQWISHPIGSFKLGNLARG